MEVKSHKSKHGEGQPLPQTSAEDLVTRVDGADDINSAGPSTTAADGTEEVLGPEAPAVQVEQDLAKNVGELGNNTECPKDAKDDFVVDCGICVS